jgi:hypothetical protein
MFFLTTVFLFFEEQKVLYSITVNFEEFWSVFLRTGEHRDNQMTTKA